MNLYLKPEAALIALCDCTALLLSSNHYCRTYPASHSSLTIQYPRLSNLNISAQYSHLIVLLDFNARFFYLRQLVAIESQKSQILQTSFLVKTLMRILNLLSIVMMSPFVSLLNVLFGMRYPANHLRISSSLSG